MGKERIYWIDWMKTFGMFFIILGHIMPQGYQWIYVFNVPLFFIISGFLGHAESCFKLFLQKNWKNLILPCVVICIMVYPFEVLFSWRAGEFELNQVPRHFFNCIVGNQGFKMPEGGLDVCWFIYTLFLCKLIQQLSNKSTILKGVTIIFCLIIALWYNKNDYHWHNAIVNTSLAYPFYAIGGGIKRMKEKLNTIPAWMPLLLVIACSLIVYLVGKYNGAAWMYDNTYGESFCLFFIGGLAGTVAVYGLSYLLREKKSSMVDIITTGSIVILGFHLLLIRTYDHLPAVFHSILGDYMASIIILIAFVPIIVAVEKYFPILLGTRKSK